MDAEGVAYMIGMLFGAVVAGALGGLAPLIIGIKKGRPFVGVVAMGTCVIAGLVLGICLSAPVGLIFTIVLLCLPRAGGIEHYGYTQGTPIPDHAAAPPAPSAATPTQDGQPQLYGRPVGPDPFVSQREPAADVAESQSLN